MIGTWIAQRSTPRRKRTRSESRNSHPKKAERSPRMSRLASSGSSFGPSGSPWIFREPQQRKSRRYSLGSNIWVRWQSKGVALRRPFPSNHCRPPQPHRQRLTRPQSGQARPSHRRHSRRPPHLLLPHLPGRRQASRPLFRLLREKLTAWIRTGVDFASSQPHVHHPLDLLRRGVVLTATVSRAIPQDEM